MADRRNSQIIKRVRKQPKATSQTSHHGEDTLLDLLQPFTQGLEERDASSSTPTAGNDLEHAVVEEQSLDEKFPSVVTDAGGDTLATGTQSKKGVIGSQPRGNHNVLLTHYSKDSNCEVCKKTNTSRARCRTKPEKRVGGIALSTKFGDLITAGHKIQNVGNESGCGHKHALIVQDDFTNVMQSHPMRTKRDIGNNVVFTRISSSVTETGKNLHRQFQ